VGWQVDVNWLPLVEEHIDHHVLFQVAQGITHLLPGKLILVKGGLVQEIVVAAVGVQVLGLAIVHLRHSKLGVVPLEGPLHHCAREQVFHLDAGNRRSLLHLVALVVHNLPGLAVQLNDHAPVQVAKVDTH
jgi:hypothetical protein